MGGLGEQIRLLRRKNGWSQIDLAKRLCISNTTLSQYETGVRTPDDDLKMKMADLFGVSMDYLMGRPQTKKSPSVSDEDIKFALFGGEGEITDEMYDEVKQFAAFVKAKHGKK